MKLQLFLSKHNIRFSLLIHVVSWNYTMYCLFLCSISCKFSDLYQDPEQLELLREFMSLQKEMMIMLLSMLEGLHKQDVSFIINSALNPTPPHLPHTHTVLLNLWNICSQTLPAVSLSLMSCTLSAGLYKVLVLNNTYSSLSLTEIPLLLNNSVLIREIPFGEREHYKHSQYLLPRILCPFYRRVLSRECPLREAPL